MSDADSRDLRRLMSTDVPNLLDDYRRQGEALRHQADQTSRLRGEVLLAADQEALNIVTTARAQIRRIVVNARRELLQLAEQIEVITEGLPAGGDGVFSGGALLPAEDGHITRDKLLLARHDVRQVLDDARPE